MTSKPSDVPTFRFSTEDWAERDRLAMWREVVGRTIVKLDTAPLSDGPFHAEAVVQALPGLWLGSWTFANLRAAVTRELLDGSDDLVLGIALSGNPIVSHRSREVTGGAGDAILMSTAETRVSSYPSPTRFLSLRLPRKMLAPLVPNPEDALMRPLPRNMETMRLLTRYVENLSGGYRLASPDLQHIVVTHVHDLVALVIGANQDVAALAEGRGVRAARLHAIKADIIKDLGRRDLTVAVIAARRGVTPRQVQRLFETEGTTFSEFVLGQRLTRAHRLLADPRFADRAISALAYEVGFATCPISTARSVGVTARLPRMCEPQHGAASYDPLLHLAGRGPDLGRGDFFLQFVMVEHGLFSEE